MSSDPPAASAITRKSETHDDDLSRVERQCAVGQHPTAEQPQQAAVGQREPSRCTCVSCSMCGGLGSIRVPSFIDYDLEMCDECGGSGIVYECDRCHDLRDEDNL